MHRRLAIVTSLLVFFWASVACSTKPAGENPTSSKQVTLPVGTIVTVRLGNAVSSKISTDGDHFRATVTRPVEIDGKSSLPLEPTPWAESFEPFRQAAFRVPLSFALPFASLQT